MPLSELIAHSTYDFRSRLTNREVAEDCSKGDGLTQSWMITEPYDLRLRLNGKELERSNIGGPNLLLAIGTDPESCVVDSVRITFQDRLLTADQAVTQAEALLAWLSAAGLRHPSPEERQKGLFAEDGAVEQNSGAMPFSATSEKPVDLVKALTDERMKIRKLVVAQMIGTTAGADVWVTNVRREQGEVRNLQDQEPSASGTEPAYLIYLDLSAPHLRLR